MFNKITSDFKNWVSGMQEYWEGLTIGTKRKKSTPELLDVDLSGEEIDLYVQRSDIDDIDTLLNPIENEKFNNVFALRRDYKYMQSGRVYLYALGYKSKMAREFLSQGSARIKAGD